MADWYVSHNGKAVGPFSAGQLKQLAASAKIHGETQVRRGNDGVWALARNVKGLFEPTQIAPSAPSVVVPITADAIPARDAESNVVEFPDADEVDNVHDSVGEERPIDDLHDSHLQPPRLQSYFSQAAATIGLAVGLGFIFLNVFGGLVAGIWLAVKGEWGFIFGGIAASIIMPWLFSVASLPVIGLAILLAFLGDPPPCPAVAVIGFLCAFWNSVLIIGWSLFIFYAYMKHDEAGLTIPLLLWVYAITISPLAYMAKFERGQSATDVLLSFAVLSYFVFVVLYFSGVQPITLTYTAAAISLIAALICTAIGVASVSARREAAD